MSTNAVEKLRPLTMAVAIGPQISELPPKPAASENNPAIVVSEVMSTGMIRLRAAYIVA